MTDELRELMRQKKELERRIQALTTGSVVHETVKIDRIAFASKYQQGKWALFFKYAHTVNRGYNGGPETRTKWQPLFNAENKEEVISRIPEVIRELTELYEEGTKDDT